MQLKPTFVLPVLLAACASSSHLPSRTTTSPVLALPGATFYPESLGVAADGTLYVGSLGGGGIVRLGPSSETAAPFVASGKNIAGVYVDDDARLLYACENDFAAQPAVPPRVVAYRLSDGGEAASYGFPQGGVCNDLAIGPARRLYVTDSAGRIYVLPPGGRALAVFSTDAQLAPSSASGFGADGIVWDGDATLYVNTFSDARLLRIAVQADGTAGTVTSIAVTPALQSPDGMRLSERGTLIVAEGAGRITEVSLQGNAATGKVLADGLDSPTSVVVTDGAYFATEGQLGYFLGLLEGAPALPFDVRRIVAR